MKKEGVRLPAQRERGCCSPRTLLCGHRRDIIAITMSYGQGVCGTADWVSAVHQQEGRHGGSSAGSRPQGGVGATPPHPLAEM